MEKRTTMSNTMGQTNGVDDLNLTTLDLPNWMKNGLVFRLFGGLFLTVVTLTLALPWRETITIPVTITGTSEPRSIVSPSRGVLAAVLVRDGTHVAANTPIGYIGDNQAIKSIKRLEEYANDVTEAAEHRASLPAPPPVVVGGDLQAAYDVLARIASEGESQSQFRSDQERINQLEALLVSLQRQRQEAKKRKELISLLIATSAERLENLQDFAKNGWASAITIATARENLAEHQISSTRFNEELEQLTSQISQAQSSINQARVAKQLNSTRLYERGRQSAINLMGAVKDWRERNAIITPISGTIRFPIPLTIGQPLSVGDEVAIVVPVYRGFTATGQVGSEAQADVKLGDEVRLVVNNYPPAKYGYISGRVNQVSEVVTLGKYSIRIHLNNGSTTANKFIVPLRQRVSAKAIITIRQGTIFEFLIETIDSILKKN
jgi:multidrug efflux pump subunit AcrA (membrane-fusion protein)